MTVVRVVVLNYEGGDDLVRAVDALAATRTDASVQIVVVDNGSTDTSVAAVEATHPEVEVRRTGTNRGFGANNDALGDLDGIDYVALVNNDAFVEPGWLDPLVDALAADDQLGAVQAKIVFEPRFVEVHVETLASVRRFDPRRFGVQLRGARVDGVDVWPGVHVASGGLGPTLEGGQRVEWTAPWAVVRVPVDAAAVRASGRVELLVATEEPKGVRLAGADGAVEVELSAEPRWVEVPLGGTPFDVINSVGGELLADGSAADRGVHQRDRGPVRPGHGSGRVVAVGRCCCARPTWPTSGSSTSASSSTTRTPTSRPGDGPEDGAMASCPPRWCAIVHAASSGVASSLLRWHVERNRLLYLTKDAPVGLAARAVLRHPLSTLSYARRDVIGPLVDRRPIDTATVRLRLSAYAGYLRLAPAMLAERRQARR